VEVRISYLLTSVLDAAKTQLHAVIDIHLVEEYSSHGHSVNVLAKWEIGDSGSILGRSLD